MGSDFIAGCGSFPQVSVKAWTAQSSLLCSPPTALFSVQGGDQVQQKCLGSSNDVLPSSISPSLPFLSIFFLSALIPSFQPFFFSSHLLFLFLLSLFLLPPLSSPHTGTAAWKHALEWKQKERARHSMNFHRGWERTTASLEQATKRSHHNLDSGFLLWHADFSFANLITFDHTCCTPDSPYRRWHVRKHP